VRHGRQGRNWPCVELNVPIGARLLRPFYRAAAVANPETADAAAPIWTAFCPARPVTACAFSCSRAVSADRGVARKGGYP
jgi:hypothetical protein